MKFKELEEQINKIAIEKGYNKKENQMTHRELVNKTESIVYVLLRDKYPRLFYNGLYVTTYRGDIIIKFGTYRNVKVKIRKIKSDKKFNRGFEQYYYLNKLEIDISNKNSSVESYHKDDLKYQKAKAEHKNNNIDKFKKFLVDKQLTYDEFMEYYDLYKANWYEIEKQLAVYDDEDY